MNQGIVDGVAKPPYLVSAKAATYLKSGDYAVITPKRNALPVDDRFCISMSASTRAMKHACLSHPDWSPSYPRTVMTASYESGGGVNTAYAYDLDVGAFGSAYDLNYNNQNRPDLTMPLAGGNVFVVPFGDLFFCVKDWTGADVVAKTQLQALNSPGTQDYDHDPATGNIIIFYQTLTNLYPAFQVKTAANAAVTAQTVLRSVASSAYRMACKVLTNGNVMFAWRDTGGQIYVAVYKLDGTQVVAAASTGLSAAGGVYLADLGSGKVALWITTGYVLIMDYSGSIVVQRTFTSSGPSYSVRPLVGLPDAGFGVMMVPSGLSGMTLNKVYRDGTMRGIPIPSFGGGLLESQNDGGLSVTPDNAVVLSGTRTASTERISYAAKLHVGGLTTVYQAVENVPSGRMGRFRKLTSAEVSALNSQLQA